MDRKVSLINAVQLFGTGVKMHQLLSRFGGLQPAIAAGGHLTQARTDGDDEVALFEALRQFGVDANAHVTCVLRVEIIKRVLKPKCVADGQLPVFSKPLQGLGGLRCPAATPGHDEGPL